MVKIRNIKVYDDIAMTCRTMKPLFSRKNGAIGLSTEQIVTLIIAIAVLFTVAAIYMAIKPNPQRVASCATQGLKIGPFA